MTQLSNQMQDLSSAFARDGYVTLPNVVSKSRLAALTEQLRGEYNRARATGELFSGGGTISGHLNCFPGAQSRFVYDELEQYGVFDFVRKLSPSATRMPNIGCNLNLPNSSAQNPHADGNVAGAAQDRNRQAGLRRQSEQGHQGGIAGLLNADRGGNEDHGAAQAFEQTLDSQG